MTGKENAALRERLADQLAGLVHEEDVGVAHLMADQEHLAGRAHHHVGDGRVAHAGGDRRGARKRA